ncbi:MAG: serine acetyltransferase, partial [Clostridia bacterium]|nr:serine acetyltransferase [Clostridia bacterium]
FKLDDNGNPIKGIKRHPDIGSHVVIYAGATILGGDTVIGDNTVIGSNAWITHSVPAGSKVFYTKQD